MNFQRGKYREEPEINLVPLIDVLLVILIFLMVTTTYSKFSELEINLPQASADKSTEHPNTISVSVDALGRYAVNRTPIKMSSTENLIDELRAAAKGAKDPVILIHADAKATHQSVIAIMEAAQKAGYSHVSFTAEERGK